MKIETKFKPGDKAFFVWKGKISSDHIACSTATSRKHVDDSISLDIYYEMERNHKFYEQFVEEELATSKEELLEKLSK